MILCSSHLNLIVRLRAFKTPYVSRVVRFRYAKCFRVLNCSGLAHWCSMLWSEVCGLFRFLLAFDTRQKIGYFSNHSSLNVTLTNDLVMFVRAKMISVSVDSFSLLFC